MIIEYFVVDFRVPSASLGTSLCGSPREIGKDVISWGRFEKTKPICWRL